jgi:hypothetical protein
VYLHLYTPTHLFTSSYIHELTHSHTHPFTRSTIHTRSSRPSLFACTPSPPSPSLTLCSNEGDGDGGYGSEGYDSDEPNASNAVEEEGASSKLVKNNGKKARKSSGQRRVARSAKDKAVV